MTEPPISEITRILTPWPAESRADDVLRVVRAMSEELKDAERALEMDERSIVPHHRNLIAEQLRSRLALAVAVIDALKRSTQFAECSGLVQALAAYDAVCASAAHPEREERADAVPRPQMGERGVHTEAIDVMAKDRTYSRAEVDALLKALRDRGADEMKRRSESNMRMASINGCYWHERETDAQAYACAEQAIRALSLWPREGT